MSNVKEVNIRATIEFFWNQDMEKEDAALLAKLFLTPSIGLKIEFTQSGMIPNRDGSIGRTMIYMVTISGQEAVSFPLMERLRSLFDRYAVSVEQWDVIDIEA